MRTTLHVFPDEELNNVKQLLQDMESYSGSDLLTDLGKLFMPALALLALMLLILWLL